ncbi:MAG: hypothetical protein IJL97_03865 [Lachnospiraceae bacterium]|nr:hypothetical protein [Clostridia bacterium]MBR0085668.1 hypothetical protein [Lachnospiraceae bacterium]
MRYIKLFDKMTEWEWYDDPITFKVFMHLLLTANWKDTKWHGIKIKRGQRVISYRGLSEECNLSIQQLRTAMAHLEATHEITHKATQSHTLITVVNYRKYQGDIGGDNTATNTQANIPSTSDIEDIELIEKEYTPNGVYEKDNRHQIPPTLDMVRAYCLERNNTVNADRFYDFYESKNWYVGKNKMRDWHAAVRTWEKDGGRSDAVTKTMKDLQNMAAAIPQDDYERLEELFG